MNHLNQLDNSFLAKRAKKLYELQKKVLAYMQNDDVKKAELAFKEWQIAVKEVK